MTTSTVSQDAERAGRPGAAGPAAEPAPATPMKLGKAAHLWQLDVLRAAAILLVFGHHLFGATYGWNSGALAFNPSGWLVPSPGNGALWGLYPLVLGDKGVTLFFVISGFCIHHSWLQSRRKAGSFALAPGDSPAGPRFKFPAFMWRRAWRIYPAYVVALFAFALLQRDKIGTLWHARGNLAWHLLMIHNLRADTLYSINASFWSLGVEWQFYLAYPLFLMLRRRGGVLGAVGVSVALGLAAQLFVSLTGRGDPAANANADVWIKLPLITWFHWCLGALVAEYWDRGRPFFRLPGPAVALLWAGVLVGSANRGSQEWVYPLWPVCFAAALERYVHRPRAAARVEKWLIPVGICSYSLYLLHQPLIERAMPRLGAGPGRAVRPLPDLALIGAALLAVVFVLSWLSFRLLEMPGVRLGSAGWKRLALFARRDPLRRPRNAS